LDVSSVFLYDISQCCRFLLCFEDESVLEIQGHKEEETRT